MYICICAAVKESDIHQAMAAGNTTLPSLQARLGVAECCQRCVTDIEIMLTPTPSLNSLAANKTST